MKYILLDTVQQYQMLNHAISQEVKQYPYAGTEMYAPEIPEEYEVPNPAIAEPVEPNQFDENGVPMTEPEVLPLTITKYKFPLSDGIMAVVLVMKGKTLYDEDMVPIFASM